MTYTYVISFVYKFDVPFELGLFVKIKALLITAAISHNLQSSAEDEDNGSGDVTHWSAVTRTNKTPESKIPEGEGVYLHIYKKHEFCVVRHHPSQLCCMVLYI
jgi:hypothetical protein